jgi:predicted ATPase/class 3 adenylate cyclase
MHLVGRRGFWHTLSVAAHVDRGDGVVAGVAVVELLYESLRSTVIRGKRIDDGDQVVLKLMGEAATGEDAASYRHAWRATRNVDGLPGISCPIALIEQDGRPGLVMADRGGVSLDRLLDRQYVDVETAVAITAGAARALAALLEASLLHLEVSTSNVVYHEESGLVELIDFDTISPLRREFPAEPGPGRPRGTPAFMAPEQTGRTGRVVDHRSDLYSLGAVLFTLLVGRPPFASSDPLLVLHAHAAQQPPRLCDLDPAIPGQVADIVDRLLEKDPNARYQSPMGLAHDLERCLADLRAGRTDEGFPLGATDLSPVLTVPQRLYGRDGARSQLRRALDRAAAGQATMVVVTGEPGVGKSTIVGSLAPEAIELGGTFASGKFEQRAGTPYDAFRAALGAVAKAVQRRSPVEAEAFTSDLQARLGGLARVLVDLVPAVESVLGPCEDVPVLPMRESRNRISTAVSEFTSAAADIERPMVLFLDDLQWAQSDSVQLLLSLVGAEIPGVLVVVAFREDDLLPDHVKALNELATRQTVEFVHVEPLDADATAVLLRDTLHCDDIEAKELASAVKAKTAGNPFFIRQFLDAMERDRVLRMDPERVLWTWDSEAIGRYPVTDNAAGAMAQLLVDLPPGTRRALGFGACVGDAFSLDDLLTASAAPAPEAAEVIWPALYRELVVTDGNEWRFAGELDPHRPIVYRFNHDRVREAALAALGPADRTDAHFRLGMARRHEPAEDRMFEAVQHLNQAVDRLDLDELMDLARCNLQVARQARTVGAFPQVMTFCETGLAVLPDRSWDTVPDVALELHQGAAEAAWVLGDRRAMDHWIDSALPHLEVPRDRSKFLNIRIRAYHEDGDHERALRLGLEVLDTLGLRLPRRPTRSQIAASLLNTRLALRARGSDSVLSLSQLTDPDFIEAHDVLSTLANVAYGAQSAYFPLFVAEAVRLTLRRGLGTSSAVGLAHYALMQVALGRYEDGVRYGQLAMRLAEREPCRARRAWCAFLYHDFVHHWKYDIRSSIDPLREAQRDAVERGDPESAALLGVVELFESFQAGIPLADILERAAALDGSFRHEAYFRELAGVTTQFLANLTGRAEDCAVIAGPYYDERDVTLTSPPAVRSAVAATKLALLFWLGRLEEAALALDAAEATLAGQAGNANIPWFHLQNAIVRLRLAPDRPETRRAVAKAEKLFRRWARLSPGNFAAQSKLIAAEQARANGDHPGAATCFDEAIAAAENHQRVLVAALAHRCAGEFHSAAQQNERARTHLRRAVLAFRRLGADAVADGIVAAYPDADVPKVATSRETVHLEQLDLVAMLHASQALAREVKLDDMLRTLVETLQQHLGAQRALVFVREGEYFVLEATTDAGEGIDSNDDNGHREPAATLDDGGDYVADIVRLVARTHEPVVIDDAQLSAHRDHPHVKANRVRSILCTPVVSRSDLVGVLYLENNRQAAAFTGRPQEVLTLLGGQIAISVQNAQLVGELHDALNRQLELTAAQSRFIPDQFLRALGKHDIRDVTQGHAVEKEFTVMASDMRGYTTHIERLVPEDAMTFLNEYLRYLEPSIIECGGFIDSYAGDGLLALFEGGADSAVRAALAMLRAQRRYNHVRTRRGDAPVRSGIGLNTGRLVLGPMGGTDRLKFSVVGDPVNVAARLEDLTKPCGAEVLISEHTYGLLEEPSSYRTRRIGLVHISGRVAPLVVHEVFDEASEEERERKSASLAEYEVAVDLYVQGDVKGACDVFAGCARSNPDDLVVRIYLDRCRSILQTGVPETWDGTIDFS